MNKDMIFNHYKLFSTLDQFKNFDGKQFLSMKRKHLISEFIQNNYADYNIKISYEKNILDTAGGVKNAIKFLLWWKKGQRISPLMKMHQRLQCMYHKMKGISMIPFI